MFDKILVVEDLDVNRSGIITALDELKIKEVESISYCDEAFLKIKKAYLKGEPYQLIISDLSFENDGTPQQLKSGDELAERIRQDFPDLKIIVFSVEDKSYRIQNLYKNLKIQGYVWKGRNGLKELKTAIHQAATSNEFYISPDLKSTIHPQQAIEITDYDIFLIEKLSEGLLQEAISKELKKEGLSPCSVSAVEKRLKFLKEHFNAKNPTHLVALTKDLGLI